MTEQKQWTWGLNAMGYLCLSGYPIQIRREKPGSTYHFTVWVENHQRQGTLSLGSAKYTAQKIALELDEFMPTEETTQ